MYERQLSAFSEWVTTKQRLSESTAYQYVSQLRSFALDAGVKDLVAVSVRQITHRVRALPTNPMRSRFTCAVHLFFKYLRDVEDPTIADPSKDVHFVDYRVEYPSPAKLKQQLKGAEKDATTLRISDLVDFARTGSTVDEETGGAVRGFLEKHFGGRPILAALIDDPQALPFVQRLLQQRTATTAERLKQRPRPSGSRNGKRRRKT